ncbi:MAG: T9SS type A sorting domain-containing protein [Ignavibacteriaceae bacterium]
MKKIITTLIILVLLPVIIMAQHIGAGPSYHTIAAKSDGTVYTWGYNGYGELGNGTTTDSNVPVAVSTDGFLSGKTITQVAAGAIHSIALASDGTVYTWGNNGLGELGNGTTTSSNVPVAVITSGVLSGKTITQVAAGNSSIALASDGTVYTWGWNSLGQLGNGTNTDSNVPVEVDQSGMGVLPVEENLADQIPSKFELSQNYPNPFNPVTRIQYSVNSMELVSLKIYDILGNEVATLVNKEQPAGRYELMFNADELSSGIYFYKLQSGSLIQTKKMILLK